MSYLIKLSHHDAIKLKRLLRETESSKVLKRYQCIHFKQQRIKNKDIALLLCVNIDTVTDWLKVFLEKGLMGLKEFDYDGRRTSVLDDYKQEIKSYVDKNIVSSVKELQGFISGTYNVDVEHSWLFRYLKKNSIVLTKRQKAILQK